MLSSSATIADLAVCVLYRGKGAPSPTKHSIERLNLNEACAVKVWDNSSNQYDMFSFIQDARRTFPGKYLVLLHDDIFFGPSFLPDLVQRMEELRHIPWGVIGNAGVAFPTFQPVRNMIDPHGLIEFFRPTIAACQLDGSVMVLHKDFTPKVPEKARGFHHYDTFLTVEAWEQNRPCFIVNAPSTHMSKGNQDAFNRSTDVLAGLYAEKFSNSALATVNGPASLRSSGIKAIGKIDFYSQTVASCIKDQVPASDCDITIAVRTIGNRPDLFERAIQSIALQKRLPARVVILIADSFQERIDNLKSICSYFEPMLTVAFEVFPSPAGNSRVEAINYWLRSAPSSGYTVFLDDDDYLFPNHVDDTCRIFESAPSQQQFLLIHDFERIYEAKRSTNNQDYWYSGYRGGFPRVESIFQNVATNNIPFCSFVFPNAALKDCEVDTRLVYFEDFSLIVQVLPKFDALFSRIRVGAVSVRRQGDNTVNLKDRSDWDYSLAQIHASYFSSKYPFLGLAHLDGELTKLRTEHEKVVGGRFNKIFFKSKKVLKRLSAGRWVIWTVNKIVDAAAKVSGRQLRA